ncbi:MAG: hypothetical protein NT049_16970 [Planctomycetota bacterium]|nr:hypothetical protein [Planctomycetota bacterium]
MSDRFVPIPPQRPAALWLIGCALVSLLAAGCTMSDGVSRVAEVGPRQFDNVVLQSQQPVLVNFYKPG